MLADTDGITFNAGSKTYFMTGWRVGYAAGPVELIKGMAKLQSQTTSAAAAFAMHALAAALDGDHACVEMMRTEFERRGAFISDAPNRAAPSMSSRTCPTRTKRSACRDQPTGPTASSRTPTWAWSRAATSATTTACASASPPAWNTWRNRCAAWRRFWSKRARCAPHPIA